MHYLRISLILLFFTLLFGFELLAQSNYVKGYIVSIEKDTIHGEIDDKQWDVAPLGIYFKSKAGVQYLTAKDLYAFYVGDNLYERHIVTVDKSAVSLKDLINGTNRGDEITTDTIFLQVILKSEYSLYYFKDSNIKKHYYFQHQDNQPQELILRKYLTKSDRDNIVKYDKIYIGQLKNFFADCPEMQKKISSSSFTRQSLLSLFVAYNECKSREIIYKYIGKKVRLDSFSLLLGMRVTNLYFTSLTGSLPKTDFSTSFNPIGGVAVGLSMPFLPKSVIINNEILFTGYKTYGSYKRIINPNANIVNVEDFGLELMYLRLYTSLQYHFVKSKSISSFIRLGVSNSFILSQSNFRIDARYQNDVLIPPAERSYIFSNQSVVARGASGLRMYELGFWAGLGFSILKKIDIEFRYEYSNGMFPSKNDSVVNSYCFLLGYQLFKR